ncbi:MAG: hypothetical protein AAFN44_11530 [Pseudomonadota bacterium]
MFRPPPEPMANPNNDWADKYAEWYENGRAPEYRLRLPVLRTPDGQVKTLEDWTQFARRDDCLDRMVPSDLRAILSNLT